MLQAYNDFYYRGNDEHVPSAEEFEFVKSIAIRFVEEYGDVEPLIKAEIYREINEMQKCSAILSSICTEHLNDSQMGIYCEIKERIRQFKLPERRLEEVIVGDIVYVSDYAHHPTEIRDLYNTLKKKYKNYKLVCFFQPHTISRSEALKEEFKESLSLFDETYIIKTFSSARESYNEDKEKEIVDYWGLTCLNEICLLNFNFCEKSAYIFIGAGDIDKIFNKIVKK